MSVRLFTADCPAALNVQTHSKAQEHSDKVSGSIDNLQACEVGLFTPYPGLHN